MTEKERRKSIFKKLREEERTLYREHDEERQRQSQSLYDSLRIKEMPINNQSLLDALLAKLRTLRAEGEIKLFRGSFEERGGFVDAEFIYAATKEIWHLYCLTDGSMGGGSLRKTGQSGQIG